MRFGKVGVAVALAAGIALGFAGAAGAAEGERQYVSNSQCKVCHNAADKGEQWNKWKAQKHAKAFETLKSEDAIKIAKDKGLTVPPSEAPECLKCHVTGYDVATKKAPAKIKPEDAVQCESCHGPNSLHVKDGQTLKFKPELAATLDVKANLHLITEDDCKKCHNEESPNWKADRYTTASGEKVGFDFEAAKKLIAHPNPQKADAGKK